MTFTAVVTCHAGDPNAILTNLLTQSRRPDEILLYLSDPPEGLQLELIEEIPGVRIFIVPDRGDWGHEKRATGLERASCDVVGFFNHDDAYEPSYIETLLGEIEGGADVAFCDWTWGQRNHGTVGDAEFRRGSSTSGNWIARTELVRSAGYLDRQYDADGTLIDRVAALTDKVVKVRQTLYHHNV